MMMHGLTNFNFPIVYIYIYICTKLNVEGVLKKNFVNKGD